MSVTNKGWERWLDAIAEGGMTVDAGWHTTQTMDSSEEAAEIVSSFGRQPR